MQIRPSSLAAAALLVAGTAAAFAPTPAGGQSVGQHALDAAVSTCGDSIKVSPVLQMTRAGSTLLGPSLSTLAVYSDGLVTMSEISPAPAGVNARMVHVDPAEVESLRAELAALGANTLCDARLMVYDIPLTTVTVFAGATDAAAHTYSYWIPEGRQSSVESAIMGFINGVVLN